MAKDWKFPQEMNAVSALALQVVVLLEDAVVQ